MTLEHSVFCYYLLPRPLIQSLAMSGAWVEKSGVCVCDGNMILVMIERKC